MKTKILIISILSTLITIALATAYFLIRNSLLLTLSITFGTIAYHFLMRLIVGHIINAIFKNKMNYSRKWFSVSKKEQQFYSLIKVKNWKAKMPTYDKQTFDPSEKSWEQIIMATCQAEIVHETIVVLSFVPIIFSIWFGALAAFIITSVISAIIDLSFVIMQRYNRPRILKLLKKDWHSLKSTF